MYSTNLENSTVDVYLFAEDGETLLDSVSLDQTTDVSYVNHDASPLWVNFPVSTPRANNQVSPSENILINEVQTFECFHSAGQSWSFFSMG